MKKKFQRFGTDIAGYALIILGIALGWLPGPGGIPLILAGLGLLSVHNPWARHIMHLLREEGERLPALVFPAKKPIERLHDVLLVIMVTMVAYLSINRPFTLWWSIALILVGLSITSLLLNRSRYKKLRKHK